MDALAQQAQIGTDREMEQRDGLTPSLRRQTGMRILVAGAGGLIGSALVPYLTSQGHAVVRLVRREAGTGEVRWDPDAGTIDCARLEGLDGVVHVASLPQARWTTGFMRRWRENHIGTNRLLAESLARCKRKAKVLVCASAQGIYASSGDQILTEETKLGSDYLAELLHDGESATAPASDAGIRVVHMRLPTVLGGASLASFSPNIRRLGSGRQWMSWVARDEVASIVHHMLVTDGLEGPVNATSPHPVRNAEFFATVSRVLGRKPFISMPTFMLRLMLGNMADALILAGRRLEPRRLLATGYQFRFPDLEVALRHELQAQQRKGKR